jgi:PAS domain S-box-containing protein
LSVPSQPLPDRRRNALSALTGEFLNPAQERAFRAGIRPVWLRRARVVILAAIAAHLITTVNDYVLLGAGALFSLLVGARLIVTAQGLAWLWLAGRRDSLRLWDGGLLIFLLLLSSAFMAMVLARPDGMRVTAPATILMLCVLYMVPMTRLWVSVLSAGYLSVGVLLAGYLHHAASAAQLVVFGVQLLTAHLVGYFVCRRIHQDARIAWTNQQVLERRERHQRLLAQLSAQFLGLRPDQLEAGIQQTFQTLCEYTGSDRAYLMEFDAGRQTGSMTHEWCVEGVAATQPAMQNIPSALMPWTSLKLQRGEIVQADDVQALPPEASAERDLNLAQGVKSFLCVPLSHEGVLVGMIGLDSVRQPRAWNPETVELLRFTGQAVFNALHRARAEEQLRKNESLYQTLASVSPVGIFRTDAEGYCTYFNDQWVRLTGLPNDMALGNRWQKAIHPEDMERVTAHWNQAVARRVATETEFRYQRADGRVVWVHACARPLFGDDGRLQGFVGTAEDITERKRAQLELEQRMRLDEFAARVNMRFLRPTSLQAGEAVQLALGDIGVFTDADRSYLFLYDWNTHTKSCTHEWCREGVTPYIDQLQNLPVADFSWISPRLLRGEIVNVPSLGLLPPEAATERAEFERESIQSLLLVPIVSSGQVAGFIGLDAVRAQRTWSPDTILLLRIAGETIMSALQREQVERTRQQHIRELERVNLELERRNTELQRLAYVTSHDLQEPLRAISGFATMLREQYHGRLDARADEYIGFATEAADRLHKLINDLLTYTRVDHQVRAPARCDLNEITRVVLDNLGETAQRLGAHIEYDALPTVVAEPLQMIQLMQHLLANALRFHGDEPPVIRLSAERGEAEWVISIADNGIGIRPEHAQRVFELFERLNPDDRHPGTGIGLPVCRRIVERHGGRIWVEPNSPRGSVFRWTIPAPLSAPADQSGASRRAA